MGPQPIQIEGSTPDARNFLLACLAFVLVWLMLHRLQSWSQGLRLFHHKSHTFSVRLFHVVYTFFTIVGAMFSFILVLYYFEDWVLLTLTLLFLLGIAWTSKQALPRFAREGTLLLNIGAVRDRERVLYSGIPWLVQSLNFYTRLVNPELVGGDIRLGVCVADERLSEAFHNCSVATHRPSTVARLS
jgi:hypothetical protein